MRLLKELAILLLLALIGLFIGTIACTPFIIVAGTQSADAMIIMQWITCILTFFIPAVVWCKWRCKANPWKTFGFKAPSTNAIALAVAFSLVSVPFGSATAEWIEMLPWPQSLRDFLDQQLVMQVKAIYVMMSAEGIFYTINSFLLIGLVTGIVEETMFRGALRKVISDHLGIHATAILVGLIFSLVHFEFYGFIWRWFLGTFYAYLVYYTGSIWTSIIAHTLNNSVAVAASLFMGPISSEPSTYEEWLILAKNQDMQTPLFVEVISTIATIAVVWFFFKNRDYFKNSDAADEKNLSESMEE